MKRVIQSSLVVVVALFAVACSTNSENSTAGNKPENSKVENKPENSILGKWTIIEKNQVGTIEFFKDGTLSIATPRRSLPGTYKFNADGSFQVELVSSGPSGTGSSGTGSLIIPGNITGEELSLTVPNEGVKRYKRM